MWLHSRRVAELTECCGNVLLARISAGVNAAPCPLSDAVLPFVRRHALLDLWSLSSGSVVVVVVCVRRWTRVSSNVALRVEMANVS